MISNKTTKEDREKAIEEALSLEEPMEDSHDEDQETNTDTEDEDTTDTKTVEDEGAGNVSEDTTQIQVAPTLEERYKASSQESQVLYAKQKKFVEAVEAAADAPEPTEEELRAYYSTWHEMTDTEKFLAKESYINKRKFDLVHQATYEGRKIDEWSEKVDTFLVSATSDPKYAKLAGRETEFKNFSMKPTRRGLDLDDLVGAFLYDALKETSPKKGSLLQGRSSGREEKPKTQYLDEKAAAKLRKNNNRLYQKYVREGKIKIEL